MSNIAAWLQQLEAGQVQEVIEEMKEQVRQYDEYWAREAAAEEAWLLNGEQLIKDLCGSEEEAPW